MMKHRPHIYIFTPDTLDNEDVILAVENTPTYKRTRQMLDDIRNTGSGNKDDKPSTDEQADTVPGIISFA